MRSTGRQPSANADETVAFSVDCVPSNFKNAGIPEDIERMAGTASERLAADLAVEESHGGGRGVVLWKLFHNMVFMLFHVSRITGGLSAKRRDST